ncbi:MAG TPA: tRNA uridine-5-carboxymethylaminomethyl(34) synthesis GTPase MnmE [Nitrospirota bacterium]|nr:tRNA uridine-5-carboxymethylaminomethyl(34) synthesis GTPase MnmE [Nitrospirota bacterium]
MLEDDTICAVSTPPGEGGIGIIRISGKNALGIAKKIFKPRIDKDILRAATHTLHYGHVIDPATGEPVDEVLLGVMHGPATYTREDIVEINCHGGMLPLWRVMDLLINAGARQADPGEFTKRAFLNGRIDLAQAEAVMDIIRAKTDLCHRAANEQLLGGLSEEISRLRDRLVSVIASVEAGIDFPEEEDIDTEDSTRLADGISDIITTIEELLLSYNYGKILRDGFATAIVGRPNVGKSSLLNALLKQNRAIVTEIPGTTRDVLEEYLSISGVPIKILDTAGIRFTHDTVEQEGVRRSLAAIESADIVLVVLDGSERLTDEDQRVLESVKGKNTIVIVNKSDLPRKLDGLAGQYIQVSLSCRTGDGLKGLKSAISDMVKQGTIGSREHAWAVNQRHKTALAQTKESLQKSLDSIISNLSPEFVAVDLRGAIDSLGLIIGATYTEDILERIFNDFCIGK